MPSQEMREKASTALVLYIAKKSEAKKILEALVK